MTDQTSLAKVFLLVDTVGRIVAIEGDWEAFAGTSGATPATRDEAMNTSLWQHLRGRRTAMFLDAVFSLCRQWDERFAMRYRLTADDLTQVCEMTVTPEPAGHGLLRIDQKVLSEWREEDGPRIVSFDHHHDRNRCSFCGAIRLGGEWRDTHVPPEEEQFFGGHALCPHCEDEGVGSVLRLLRERKTRWR